MKQRHLLLITAVWFTLLPSASRADVFARDFGFVASSRYQAEEEGHLTPELQAAVDYCYDSGDHKLVIDPGVYKVNRITYFPGLIVEGNGATLKRVLPSWDRNTIFESYSRHNTDVNVARVVKAAAGRRGGRVVNSLGEPVLVADRDRRRYVWSGKGLSPLTVFRNLKFRGDLEAFEPREFTSHQREHSHGLVVAGKEGAAEGDRLNVLIENVDCENFTGNGMYFRNAKVVLKNYQGKDCFRGLWSATVNVDIEAYNGTSTGRWGGIDIEPTNDIPGKILIDGLLASHDLDIALRNDWTVTIKNAVIEDGPINLVTRHRGKLVIEKSRLMSKKPMELRTLGRDGEVIFRDVDVGGADWLWIQRNGFRNRVDMRATTNLGRITEAQKERDAANVLLR